MLAELSKYMGAKKVMVSQRSKKRVDMAKTFNIDVVISSLEENFVDRVMEETNGLGADVVITACASVEAQEQALSVIKNRGRINFFGGLPKGSKQLSLDSNLIHYKEIFLLGSHGSVPRHHRLALELLESGVIDVTKYISHKFKLEDILEAFNIVENRQGMKVILKP
jgi:L-iditol 2-dehydrogenase